jgi:hypothetical protein
MTPPLPPEIRVETGVRGSRYLLPERDTGPLKMLAGFVIGFGCLFAGFAVFWMFSAAVGSQKAGLELTGVLFALFGLPFLAVGLGIIGLGFFVLSGRCEIEVQPGELLIRERGGPFRWTRRIPIKDIQRFSLGSDRVLVNDQPVMTGALSDVGMLVAEVGAARPRFVLLGYPRAWTEAMAARLTADLAAQTGNAPLPTSVTRLDLDEGQITSHGDRFEPPAGTSIRIMEQAGGIVVVVPPSGFKGTARSVRGFGVCWLGFSMLATVVVGVFASQGKGAGVPLVMFLVIGAFDLIGVAMVAYAVSLARRKASIRASHGELIIVQQSPFGEKTFKCSGELAAICVGDSGTVINNTNVQEIQVHTRDGAKHGFFSNLMNEEMHWLATHLRHATGVGHRPGESSAPPKLA